MINTKKFLDQAGVNILWKKNIEELNKILEKVNINSEQIEILNEAIQPLTEEEILNIILNIE